MDGALSEYEEQRLANIRRNQEMLASLGLASDEETAPVRTTVRRPRAPPGEPTRRSRRIADLPEQPAAVEPQPLPEERRVRRRVATPAASSSEQSFISAMSAELDGRIGNENCAQRARIREFLSRPIEQIDRAILEEIGTLPLRPDGTFMYVYNIPQRRDNTFAFRATMWSKDYGLYCTERLAAIVARYAQMHPEKSREEVWANIGIVDLDNIDEATATRLYEERTGESNAMIDRANQLVAVARASRVAPADSAVPPPFAPLVIASSVAPPAEPPEPPPVVEPPEPPPVVPPVLAGLPTGPVPLGPLIENVVRCSQCYRVLDNTTGTVCPSIGPCDTVGCENWECYACCSVPSSRLESFDGAWFCGNHRWGRRYNVER